MKKLNKNEAGFGAVEGMLIVVVVMLLGVVGYMVYKNHNNTNSTLTSSNTTSTTPVTAKSNSSTSVAQSNECQIFPVKPASDWKTFTSDKYKFSISYPANWSVDTSGGSENNSSNTPILTELLFTPPGNQGPQYGIEVTAQSLTASTKDWTDSVDEARTNHKDTTYTIINQKNCEFNTNSAIRIDTKQSDAAGTDYDGEFYVAANGYSYKFSTGYSRTTSNPFQDETLLNVVESLSIK